MPRRGTPRAIKEAFVKTVALAHDSDECLLWPFAVGKRYPYPIFVSGMFGHRYVCQLANGEPPDDGFRYDAAHSCGQHSCVNPRHLSWKTRKANKLDQIEHGTLYFGERHAFAKLTAKQVREIREAAIAGREPQRVIAKKYGIQQSYVSEIKCGRKWRLAA